MANIDDFSKQINRKSENEISRKVDYKSHEGKYSRVDYDTTPHIDLDKASCKLWFAKVFTYCRNDQLEGLINNFLDKINEDQKFKDFCFKPEQTVFLGCTCHCGRKQTILYYSLTCERTPKQPNRSPL